MTRSDIVARLAQEQRVEMLVCSITHSELTADLKDLCQMIYLILLQYNEEKIVDLWEHEQIDFFLIRIIQNQYYTKNSPFHNTFKKRQRKMVQITESVGYGEDNGNRVRSKDGNYNRYL